MPYCEKISWVPCHCSSSASNNCRVLRLGTSSKVLRIWVMS